MISRLAAAFVSRFQRLTLKEYTKEQFIEVAIGLARQYLLMKDTDRREAIAEASIISENLRFRIRRRGEEEEEAS